MGLIENRDAAARDADAPDMDDVRRLRVAPRQLRARRKVARILDAAHRVLAEQGLSALTTSNVARAAGVPVGSVYTYFRDRDSILMTLGAHVFDMEDAEIVAAIRAVPADADLARAVDGVMAAMRQAFGARAARRQLAEALEQFADWRAVKAASAMRMAEEIAAHPAFARAGRTPEERLRAARVAVAMAMATMALVGRETDAAARRAFFAEGVRAVSAYLRAVTEG